MNCADVQGDGGQRPRRFPLSADMSKPFGQLLADCRQELEACAPSSALCPRGTSPTRLFARQRAAIMDH